MTVYRTGTGDEIVVCDGCGVGHDGTRPNVTTLAKVDFTAEMRAAGIDAVEVDVQDYCPSCNRPEAVNG
jgi:hypothetical protein